MLEVALVLVGGAVGFAASLGQQWLQQRHEVAQAQRAAEHDLLRSIQHAAVPVLNAAHGIHDAYVVAAKPGNGLLDVDEQAGSDAASICEAANQFIDARIALRVLVSRLDDDGLRERLNEWAAAPLAMLNATCGYEEAYDAIDTIDFGYRDLLEEIGSRLRTRS